MKAGAIERSSSNPSGALVVLNWKESKEAEMEEEEEKEKNEEEEVCKENGWAAI